REYASQSQQPLAVDVFSQPNRGDNLCYARDYRPGCDHHQQSQRSDARPKKSDQAGGNACDALKDEGAPTLPPRGTAQRQNQVEDAIDECVGAEKYDQRVNARHWRNESENSEDNCSSAPKGD